MKITGSVAPGAALAPAAAAPAAAAPAAAPAPAPLQSDTLAPAVEALRALPDFDHARVAELRDALARGELPFDASRLAGLIERFHGAKR
ncbi:MAG TPA: flagellar biosynthesis anti-sigma factor FlgM [Telluria sp.]|nr:flagellar biosynthesis anti-sigma factor FlgM [Telluria sp.]